MNASGNAVATIQTGRKSQAYRLSRLAIVLSEPLRLKIVSELYMREMSPSQFFAEFGGGSVARVNRHFQTLVKYGWLEFIREESGGKRRGGIEHFYRATELAILGNDVFLELPYSVRAAFSATTFEQFADRVIEAVEADTFTARPDGHFTCTQLVIDQLGWDRVIAATDALFESLFEEQEEAKLRAFESEEKLALATIGLGGFESPSRDETDPGEHIGADLVEFGNYQAPFMWRLSKVLSDHVCLQILAELNQRAMSATQFHKEFGGATKAGIHRRFKTLSDLGWLGIVDEKTGGSRRGAKERFYRATRPAIADASSRPDVPDSIKATSNWQSFERFSTQIKEALDEGTVDARFDRHLTWSSLLLDQLGWERVAAAINRTFTSILTEQENAKLRLADSGDAPITMTVAMAGFESPKESPKAP